jgi:hypothetical protein
VSEKTRTATRATSAPTPRKPRKRGLLGRLRLALLLIILLALIAMQGPVLRRLLVAALKLDAWRQGAVLTIGEINGNILDPIRLRNVVWTRDAESGPLMRIEIPRAYASLAWSNLFPAPLSGWIRTAAEAIRLTPIGKNGRFFQELDVEDVTAKVILPGGGMREPAGRALGGWIRPAMPALGLHPAVLRVHNGDLILAHGAEYLRALGARFSIGEIEPGNFSAKELRWKSRAGGRVFRDVKARTALQDSKVTLAGLRLAPDVVVETLTASTGKPGSGKLALSASLAAFGGQIDIEGEGFAPEGSLRLDATGTFSNVNIGRMAVFLALSDAAGGVLKEGRFTFRGAPGDFSRAEATVRLEADAFQWESRQWDSLVLGLSLLDQRLQIPELQLRQGKNQITIKGSMALPEPGVAWWNRQFDLKLDADIRNLTDLSALVLPDFKFAAGQLVVRGSVSGSGSEDGKPAQFDGQIIVNGSALQWRTAPVDLLNAALLFSGRELQIVGAHLLHGDDFLRGSGRISLADGSYSGEVRLSAKDLAAYKVVVSPAVLPAPLAGGAEITWSGKGSAKSHEAEIAARLTRFRVLGPRSTLPLDAEFSGACRPNEVRLDRLRVSEDGTSFTAAGSIAPGAVSLRDIRIEHTGRLWLQGEAVLPLSLWKRWPDVTFPGLLNDETSARLRLEANELELSKVSRLTGIEWPLAGTLTGHLTAEGKTSALKLGGAVQFAHGTLPLDWNGNLVRAVDAAFVLDAATIRLDRATGIFPNGGFSLSGALDLKDVRKPAVRVEGSGTNKSEPFQFTAEGPAASLKITASGPAPFPAQPQPPPPPAQDGGAK